MKPRSKYNDRTTNSFDYTIGIREETMLMKNRPAQDDRSTKSFDCLRLSQRDDRSVRSWGAKTTATLTGGGAKNWNARSRHATMMTRRDKHDPDGINMRHVTKTASDRMDPPAEIDVVAGSYLEDCASVSSAVVGGASSKSFSFGKIWKSMSFRRKGVSVSAESTSGTTSSFFGDAPYHGSNSMKREVAPQNMRQSTTKSPRRSHLSAQSAVKPIISTCQPSHATLNNNFQRVNFQPTTVARYFEESTVADSVHSVTTCQYDSLGTTTTGTRKKLKKKIKKKKIKAHTKEGRRSSDQCRVMGYPCVELKTGIQVVYSGPVNESFQPHGEGEFYVLNKMDGSRFHFRGTIWENGFMVSSQLSMFQKAVDLGSLESGSNLQGKDTIQSRHTAAKVASKEQTVKKINATISESNTNWRSNGYDKSGDPTFKNAANNDVFADGHSTMSTAASTSTHPEYSLGQIARSRTDMLIQPTLTLALQSTSTLRVFEKAFLQRSNGLWTVAMLADRAMQPRDSYRVSSKWYTEEEVRMFDEKEMEESMLFVISEEGATKIVPKRYWGRCVRKINNHCNLSMDGHPTHPRGGDDAARKEGSYQSNANRTTEKIDFNCQYCPSSSASNPQSDELEQDCFEKEGGDISNRHIESQKSQTCLHKREYGVSNSKSNETAENQRYLESTQPPKRWFVRNMSTDGDQAVCRNAAPSDGMKGGVTQEPGSLR